jgi:antagonist of KipI
MLEVIDPGLLATIQDAGRPDASPLGVPRAGACDPLALAAANLLLGDQPDAPVVELTGGQPAFAVIDDLVLAVTGADLGLRSDDDGWWVRPGTSVLLRAGTRLRATAAPRTGVRTYLAVPGGVDVPRVLGSASTCLVGAFGGMGGRRLVPGDIVRGADRGRRIGAGHAWPGPGAASGVVAEPDPITVRVTDGPHRAALDGVARATLATDWVVSAESDRVGLRLAHPSGSDGGSGDARTYDSFALRWGAIEVPPDGAPIVILPDGPTVGGYPVPLVVASVDLPRVGQLRPGDRVRFRHLARAEARAELLAADRALGHARASLAVARSVW